MPAGMRVVVAGAVLALSAGCVGDEDGAPPTRDGTRESVPSIAGTEGSGTPDAVVDADPYDTVRNVYRGVAENAPEEVCARFTVEAARQFAGHFESESCTTVVVLVYHGLVSDPEAYANTSLGYFTAPDADIHAEINSCEFEVRGGPRLGVFVLDQGASDEWMITAHRMEECDR